MISIEELKQLVVERDDLLEKNDFLRKGQAFFITLEGRFPEVAEFIRNTNIDPFYNDDRLDNCILYIINEAKHIVVQKEIV